MSGKAIKDFLQKNIKSEWEEQYQIVADNYFDIKHQFLSLADKKQCSLIITTGGTGPAPRDITPEVTEKVCNRMLPGFGEIMRMHSLKYVTTSILSRQTAGIR